jgi:hypothetical protein
MPRRRGYREVVRKVSTSVGAADLVPPVALAVLGAADLALSGRGDRPPGRPPPAPGAGGAPAGRGGGGGGGGAG